MNEIRYNKKNLKYQLESVSKSDAKFELHVYRKNLRVCDIDNAKLALAPKGNFCEYIIYIQHKKEDFDDVQFCFNFDNIIEIYTLIDGNKVVIDIEI